MSEGRKAEYREMYDRLEKIKSDMKTVAHALSEFKKDLEKVLDDIPGVEFMPAMNLLSIGVYEGIENIALAFDAEIVEKLTGEGVCLEVKIPGANVLCYQCCQIE